MSRMNTHVYSLVAVSNSPYLEIHLNVQSQIIQSIHPIIPHKSIKVDSSFFLNRIPIEPSACEGFVVSEAVFFALRFDEAVAVGGGEFDPRVVGVEGGGLGGRSLRQDAVGIVVFVCVQVEVVVVDGRYEGHKGQRIRGFPVGVVDSGPPAIGMRVGGAGGEEGFAVANSAHGVILFGNPFLWQVRSWMFFEITRGECFAAGGGIQMDSCHQGGKSPAVAVSRYRGCCAPAAASRWRTPRPLTQGAAPAESPVAASL